MNVASTASSEPSFGLVLGGGGARAAYQAGALRYLGETFPRAPFPIVTASGMGAVTAAFLAGTDRSWREATRGVVEVWSDLRPERVYTPRSLWDLVSQLVRQSPSPKQSLLDPSPLRELLDERLAQGADGTLSGIDEGLADGWLEAVAMTTSHYGTLSTITWTQGRSLDDWPHARRTARTGPLTVDHVRAAMGLALLYPAVSIDREWHGAGVGMLHPLAPALRLGADRILAVSTRSASRDEASAEEAYPSPLQVASILSNTLLQDTLHADAAMMGRIDRLVRSLPPDERDGVEPADVLVLRPSVPLTAVAESVNEEVDASMGAVLQYLHAEEARLPDLLSMLLFAPAYLRRLLLLGYSDARQQHDRLADFLSGD
jgi:NTE family protein